MSKDNKNTEHLHIRISPELKGELTEFCDKRKVKESKVVRHAIKEEIRK